MPRERERLERMLRECREVVDEIEKGAAAFRRTERPAWPRSRETHVEHAMDLATRRKIARKLADLKRELRSLETRRKRTGDDAFPDHGGSATRAG